MSLAVQTPPPARAWKKPYFTTLLAVAVVAGALGYSQFKRRFEAGFASGGAMYDVYSLGWPREACGVRTESAIVWFAANQPLTTSLTNTEYHWEAKGVVFNSVAGMLILLSTAFMCERWRRNRRRSFQFSLRALMIAVTVSSLLLMLYLKESDLVLWRTGSERDYLYLISLRKFPWYLSAPILFGLACTLYALGALALASGSLVMRKLVLRVK